MRKSRFRSIRRFIKRCGNIGIAHLSKVIKCISRINVSNSRVFFGINDFDGLINV
jgi:hypothetical protein